MYQTSMQKVKCRKIKKVKGTLLKVVDRNMPRLSPYGMFKIQTHSLQFLPCNVITFRFKRKLQNKYQI